MESMGGGMGGGMGQGLGGGAKPVSAPVTSAEIASPSLPSQETSVEVAPPAQENAANVGPSATGPEPANAILADVKTEGPHTAMESLAAGKFIPEEKADNVPPAVGEQVASDASTPNETTGTAPTTTETSSEPIIDQTPEQKPPTDTQTVTESSSDNNTVDTSPRGETSTTDQLSSSKLEPQNPSALTNDSSSLGTATLEGQNAQAPQPEAPQTQNDAGSEADSPTDLKAELQEVYSTLYDDAWKRFHETYDHVDPASDTFVTGAFQAQHGGRAPTKDEYLSIVAQFGGFNRAETAAYDAWIANNPDKAARLAPHNDKIREALERKKRNDELDRRIAAERAAKQPSESTRVQGDSDPSGINVDKFIAQADQELQTLQAQEKTSQTQEVKAVTSEQEVTQRIQEQVTKSMKGLSLEDIEQRRQELKARPQLGSVALSDTLVGIDQQPTFAWVQTDKIAGRTWEQPDSWASEIESRKGRIAQVGKEITDSAEHPENIEHVFHPQKSNERIKLTAIDGPQGPIYYVDDGTHRVAAGMAVGLSEIPCDVKKVAYPLEQVTSDTYKAEDWQRKIELGLIDGQIQDVQTSNGETIKRLNVRSEVLPWIRTTSQADLIKISRAYEQMYPGSLDNLKIPKQALLDPIANNYYMAGRWDEWIRMNPAEAGNQEQTQGNQGKPLAELQQQSSGGEQQATKSEPLTADEIITEDKTDEKESQSQAQNGTGNQVIDAEFRVLDGKDKQAFDKNPEATAKMMEANRKVMEQEALSLVQQHPELLSALSDLKNLGIQEIRRLMDDIKRDMEKDSQGGEQEDEKKKKEREARLLNLLTALLGVVGALAQPAEDEEQAPG